MKILDNKFTKEDGGEFNFHFEASPSINQNIQSRKPIREVAVVGHQHETFAFKVEPANGIQMSHCIQKITNRPSVVISFFSTVDKTLSGLYNAMYVNVSAAAMGFPSTVILSMAGSAFCLREASCSLTRTVEIHICGCYTHLTNRRQPDHEMERRL